MSTIDQEDLPRRAAWLREQLEAFVAEAEVLVAQLAELASAGRTEGVRAS